MGAKERDFIFVNALGNVSKVQNYCIGTYGAEVYRIINGKLIRQYGL